MFANFNGVYKENGIFVDVVQIDYILYDLNENYLWFEVGIAVESKSDIKISDFNFYLFDSNKKIFNPVSLNNSYQYHRKNVDFSVLVGFEFKPDYFYNAPTFGFYYTNLNRVELIKLVC